jgi:2-methylisocitrate lyase-like PEP mutase family enzyme
MEAASRFRDLLRRDEMIVAPGAYDAISALTIQQAGFHAVYMTGSGTAASLGYPDIGLVTMSEMVENAARIARAVSIPLIADADTGYGNELNVVRTVREFEARGVAGIHIEDQVSPKRCGHLDGKEVVPRDAFVAKIRAAVFARRSPDFIVIARTDARAVMGLDEAVARANEALSAGADMAFVEAAQSLDELARIPREVRGPCVLNLIAGGRTPLIGFDDAASMGYRVAILPGVLFRNAIATFDRVLSELKSLRAIGPVATTGPIEDGFRRFGLDEWSAIGTEARER